MQKHSLSETVPAALRAELARSGVLKGVFARSLGRTEQWLYRHLTGRAPLTLGDLDAMCRELGLEAVIELRPAPAPKKTTAGRGVGRRSRTPNPSGRERNGQ